MRHMLFVQAHDHPARFHIDSHESELKETNDQLYQIKKARKAFDLCGRI